MKPLLVAATVALLAAPSAPAADACTPLELEKQVMCPTCEGQTLDQSQAPAAQRLKALIRARCGAGASDDDVKAELVYEFGQQILAAPPQSGFGLLAWVLPIAGLVAGAAAVGVAAWRWSRRRDPEPPLDARAPSANGPVRLDPELERRLDEELAHFD